MHYLLKLISINNKMTYFLGRTTTDDGGADVWSFCFKIDEVPASCLVHTYICDIMTVQLAVTRPSCLIVMYIRSKTNIESN